MPSSEKNEEDPTGLIGRAFLWFLKKLAEAGVPVIKDLVADADKYRAGNKGRPVLAEGLRNLNESLQSLPPNSDPVEALTIIKTLMTATIGYSVRVSLACPKTFPTYSEIEFTCSAGTPAINRSPLPAESVAGYCLRENAIVYMPDRSDIVKAHVLRRHGNDGYEDHPTSLKGWFAIRPDDAHWKALICVPIRLNNTPIAALCIDCTKSGAFGALDWAEMEVCCGLFTSHVWAVFFDGLVKSGAIPPIGAPPSLSGANQPALQNGSANGNSNLSKK